MIMVLVLSMLANLRPPFRDDADAGYDAEVGDDGVPGGKDGKGKGCERLSELRPFGDATRHAICCGHGCNSEELIFIPLLPSRACMHEVPFTLSLCPTN